jgi:hypothetical protein
MKNRAEGKEDAELESKWGFLKNIINIDVFFAGPGNMGGKADDKESAKEVEEDTDNTRDVRDGENINPISPWKKSSKKDKEADLEEALEDGEVVTDKDGNIWKKNEKNKEKEIKKLKKKYEEKEKDDKDDEEIDKLKKAIEKKENKTKTAKAKDESPVDNQDVKSKELKKASTPEQRGKADIPQPEIEEKEEKPK